MALYNLGGGGGGNGWPDNGGTEPGVIDWSHLPGGANPFDPQPTTPTTAPTTPTPTGYTPSEKPLTDADLEKVAGGKQSKAPGVTTPTTPAYVNLSDPLHKAIWDAYAKKGKTPRDQADFQYWVDKVNQTGGWDNPGNQAYWLNRFASDQGGVGDYQERPEAGGQPGGGASAPAGGGIFSDPATAAWEKALNALVVKLQGPAYTPEQQALIQTSVHEPIQQANDAAHQALIRNLAGRNLNPKDGIAQDQSNQIDRFYQQQKDLADRGFATNAINLGNQNQLQALGLLKEVPQYADSRLDLALRTMAPNNVNPLSALQTYLSQNNINDQQSQQYWAAIATALATLFGGK